MKQEELIEALRHLSDEDRRKVFQLFCRGCGVFIGTEKDWSGGNYCYMCSPDPKD